MAAITVRVPVAVSADNNGWDGCISLAGTAGDGSSYGVTLPSGTSASGDLAGNAWGSDVVGWISFNGAATNGSAYKVTFTATYIPPPTMTVGSFYANPTRVRKGGASTLYYTVTNPPASCTITGSNGFSATVSPASGVQGSVATNAITAATQFTINCGSVSASVNVDIVPTYQEL